MSSNLDSDSLPRSIHNHWVLYLVEGAALIVLGLFAFIIPSIASPAATRWLGWIFIGSGLIGLLTTFWVRHAPGFWWSLISAALAVLVGIVLIANGSEDLYGGLIGWPFQIAALAPLRQVVVLFFLIEGGASIMFAVEHRRHFSGRWTWMLCSGMVDLILAAIIIFDLPGSSAWTVGLLIAINMVLGGASLMAMGLHARADRCLGQSPVRAAR